jgi:hypothetical protein
VRNLIYYPGFEVESANWLKFALLYIEELNPIIPPAGDRHLSALYQRLMNETDLVVPHRPDITEGQMATLDAVDAVERVLRYPSRYSLTFRSNNMTQVWGHPGWHNHLLFRDKYTYAWEEFCLSHGFGTQTDEGIAISQDLAHVYMTLLAHAVADQRQVSPITDYPHLDRFAIFAHRAPRQDPNTLQVAQGVLRLQLPSNIDSIEFADVINFRNRPGYMERLRAFHFQLDKFLSGVEGAASPQAFVSTFDGIWREFVGEVVSLGLEALTIGLGTWILLDAPSATREMYLKELVVGGASFLVGATIGIRNAWRDTQSQRYTRKYLADLTRLRPAHTLGRRSYRRT